MECRASVGCFRGHSVRGRVSVGIGSVGKQSAVSTVEIRASHCSSPHSSSFSSLYDVLYVSRNVNERDLKTAYRRMALRYHPDVCPPAEKKECTRMFVKVLEAYEILSNPVLRREYDWRLQNSLDFSDREGRLRVSKSLWEAQLLELVKRRRKSCYNAESWGSRIRSRKHDEAGESAAP